MRIIGGSQKGKKLASIKGSAIRPTSDRIREALFNIIGDRVIDATVLDLYAGTGAFAIEALSRGAAHAVLIDDSAAALAVIEKNIAAFNLQAHSRILKWNAAADLNLLPMGGITFDLIFMDPPYHQGYIASTLNALKTFDAVSSHTLLIVEHSRKELICGDTAPILLADQRRYGKTLVSFLTYMI